MLCPDHLCLTQVRWHKPVGVIFYGHHLCGHNLITFVRYMRTLTDFNFGSVFQNCILWGPGIPYLVSIRVWLVCIRDHV